MFSSSAFKFNMAAKSGSRSVDLASRIDEEWIKQRVHLKHDNLDDVKSLSLPGSYHEKISFLGTSLHSFTRLKHLDLSRNSICSLEGIGHLQMLETLNLYYNNISTLKDLYQLRTLSNLKELDIRLNPVTKSEPDHRLFVIHMLPSLKKLDDRSVRDSERKAALMHFNTDQASEFTDDRLQDDNYFTSSDRFTFPPRAELVRHLGPKSALDNDDVLVLDMIARKDRNHSRPSLVSGSKSKFPDSEDYPRQELVNMHIMDEEKAVQKNAVSHHQTAPLTVDFNGNIKPAPHNHVHKSQRAVPSDSLYAPYPAQGNFTPTPRPAAYHHTAEGYIESTGSSSSGEAHGQETGHQRSKDFLELDHDQRPAAGQQEERLPQSHDTDSSSCSRYQGDQPQASNKASSEQRLLHKLVDLVDKYWNGSKSLHHHTKFKELAIDLLKTYQSTAEHSEPERDITSMKQLRQEMLLKEEELNRLSEQFSQQHQECDAIRAELEKEKAKQQQLEDTSQELTTLHARFKQIQEENQSLKVKLESKKDTVIERQRQSDEAINNYKVLQDENHRLKQRLDQQNANLQQLNELASMLQESHRSLVATNDHLLVELAQEKDRHKSEVNQLNWSYKQLKKSIDWIPNVHKTSHKT